MDLQFYSTYPLIFVSISKDIYIYFEYTLNNKELGYGLSLRVLTTEKKIEASQVTRKGIVWMLLKKYKYFSAPVQSCY